MAEQGRISQQLNGAKVLVATPGCPGLHGLPEAIRALGAECLSLNLASDFTDLATIESAFARVRTALGGIDALVLAVGNAQSRQAQPLAAQSAEQWRAACLDPLRTSRHCLQAAWRVLAGHPASIVLLGPNLSLTGAPGLVALSVLSEGQRGLMKSAARQWGGQGIRLNWLGVASTVFAAELADARLPQSPEMGPPPPALGAAPEVDGGVVRSIAMLIGSKDITGASIPVDGGLWMVP
ncbi:3-oxoacyl-[acyl-carrier-protein] reductase FabG [compost metagenome]